MHAVSVAFPMSSAAARSISAPGSSVISSMTIGLPLGQIPGGLPAGTKRGVRGGIACSAATMQDPCGRLPAPDFYAGSAAPSVTGFGGHPTLFSPSQGVTRGDTDDFYVCQGLAGGFIVGVRYR